MSQNRRNRKMTRASMVSKDSTPVAPISGELKKKGRGKRWGVYVFFLLVFTLNISSIKTIFNLHICISIVALYH